MPEARIKIYRRRYETTGGRRSELEPQLHYTCWATVKDLYGSELYKALEIRLQQTAVFEMRYCRKLQEVKNNLKEYFVEFEGEKYDIYAGDMRQNQKQYVILKTNRVT